MTATMYEVSFGGAVLFLNRLCDVCTAPNTLNWMYTSNGWIVWCMNLSQFYLSFPTSIAQGCYKVHISNAKSS